VTIGVNPGNGGPQVDGANGTVAPSVPALRSAKPFVSR